MICVNSVNVYPSRIAIKTGTWYYNVHAEVCPTNATCPNVTWSSSDPSIAIVHPTSGYIHGGRPGTATIYATATDGSGRRGCCTVTVSQRIYVNSITLNTFQISIQRNNNYLLTAEVCPSNADNKAINWCSSNTEVATVNGGRVYAHKKGAAVITAAAADGSGTEAKCYVNVTENYLVVLITVEPACKTLAIGESVFLRETVYPNHATNKEVCWSSSNEYVATVNPTSGFVAAKHAGTATIYATAQDGSGKRGCCQITVIPPVHVTGITLCPQEQSIRIGETKQLEAVLSPANATNRSISWCSSNPDVVSVGYYSGIIRALSEGTAVSTATASGGFTAQCTITTHYCGRENFHDVTQHSLVLQNDGYYICSKCGYKVKSPALQDKEILNTEDYYKVLCCYLSIPYSATIEKENTPICTLSYIPVNTLLSKIDDIRSQQKYAEQYDYVDINGIYKREDTEANLLIVPPLSLSYNKITNGNLWFHNGLANALVNIIGGFFVPKIYQPFFIASSISNIPEAMGTFLSELARNAGYPEIGIILDVILFGASADDTIEIGDIVVYISIINGLTKLERKFVFSEEGLLKAQYHGTETTIIIA